MSAAELYFQIYDNLITSFNSSLTCFEDDTHMMHMIHATYYEYDKCDIFRIKMLCFFHNRITELLYPKFSLKYLVSLENVASLLEFKIQVHHSISLYTLIYY